MTDPTAEQTPRPLERDASAERIIAFTDAAVAIALTLLVLPLMEAVAEVVSNHEDVTFGPWIAERTDSVIGFLMSFVLVAAYWTIHHGAMRDVRRFEGRMLTANFLWILAIVIMPVTTGVTIAFERDLAQILVYLGDFALIAIALGWLEIEVIRHPAAEEASPAQWRRLGVSAATIASLLVCLALIVWTPLGWLGMFAMALVGPLSKPLGQALRRALAR